MTYTENLLDAALLHALLQLAILGGGKAAQRFGDGSVSWSGETDSSK